MHPSDPVRPSQGHVDRGSVLGGNDGIFEVWMMLNSSACSRGWRGQTLPASGLVAKQHVFRELKCAGRMIVKFVRHELEPNWGNLVSSVSSQCHRPSGTRSARPCSTATKSAAYARTQVASPFTSTDPVSRGELLSRAPRGSAFAAARWAMPILTVGAPYADAHCRTPSRLCRGTRSCFRSLQP